MPNDMNPRPTKTATDITARAKDAEFRRAGRLLHRLYVRGDGRYDAFEALTQGIEGMSDASLLDNGSEAMAVEINDILDAQTKATEALSRLMTQIELGLEADDREDRANARGDEHATGDVAGEVRQ